MLSGTTRKRLSNILLLSSVGVYLLLLVYAVITADYLWYWAVAAIPFALLYLYLAFEHPGGYLYGLYLLLPLSVNLSDIGMGIGLSVPGELLIVPIALLVVADLLTGRSVSSGIWKHPVTIALLINIVWMGVTAVTGTMLLVSLKYIVIRMVYVLAFFFLIARKTDSVRRGMNLISFFAISTVAVVIWAVFRHARFGFIQEVNGYAPQPFFADHTEYGAMLALLLPVAVISVFINRKVRIMPALFFYLIVPLLLAGILLSYSRAVWISVAMIVPAALLLAMRVRFRYVLSAIAVMILLLFGLRGNILQQLNTVDSQRGTNLTEHVASSVNIRTSVSNLERINRWESALDMFRERPLLGFGPGTYQFQYAPYQDKRFMTRISTWYGDVGGVHSEYLKPLAESGVIGFISFIAMVLLTVRSGFSVALRAKKREVRLLAAGVLLGLITYYIHGFVNYFMHTDKIAALFFGFMAILVVLDTKYVRNEQ